MKYLEEQSRKELDEILNGMSVEHKEQLRTEEQRQPFELIQFSFLNIGAIIRSF